MQPSVGRAKAIRYESFQVPEELAVLRAIVARERGLDDLLALCSAFEDDADADSSVALLEAVLRVRALSLAVVDAVAGWRRRMVPTLPFVWRGVNYVLKMASDLDFLSRSRLARAALDGVRLPKRNPFATVGGLDQSLRACWQRELPDAADLPVLLDSTAGGHGGSSAPLPARIRLAEHFLLLEERRCGRLAAADAALVDRRLETLVKREAEFASKRRFGAVGTRGADL
ncbi:hypothetical protein PybrP1_001472 [[Pythium] brassicae (nom. inval.)]|nr:hypothetical protein PybrP1_001472 [[Pythium] brassicae (nom. inval.)]